MNVWLINQFFRPAQAPTAMVLASLADELVRRGHAVTVFASGGEYGAEHGGTYDVSPAVRVVRIGSGDRHGSGMVAKLREYLQFFQGSWRELNRLSPPPDAMVCMTTPPFIGLLGARLRKTRGTPYLLWEMDLYPEALMAHGFLDRWNPLQPLLRHLARIERRRASCVVALGPDMAARLHRGGVTRMEVVPFWSHLIPSPEALARARELRRVRGWADEDVVLLYHGNMGRAHRAEEFAAWAERRANSLPRFRFVFSGEGARRRDWERRWSGCFEFLPRVPVEWRTAHLLAADVHLISQQPEWEGIVVPSKFQVACALGRPVAFAGPPTSAVGTWVAEADAGWLLPPADASALDRISCEVADAACRSRKGTHAFQLFNRCFTPAGNCGRLAALVESLSQEAP